MTAEGVFPKSDGDIHYASEDNFFFSKIAALHNGSGLNVTTAGGSAVLILGPSIPLVQAKYLRNVVEFQGHIAGNLNGNDFGGPITMSVGVAQSGTSPTYTSLFSGTVYSWEYGAGGLGANTGWGAKQLIHHESIHTLTSGQKISGTQIQIILTGYDANSVLSGTAFMEWA